MVNNLSALTFANKYPQLTKRIGYIRKPRARFFINKLLYRRLRHDINTIVIKPLVGLWWEKRVWKYHDVARGRGRGREGKGRGSKIVSDKIYYIFKLNVPPAAPNTVEKPIMLYNFWFRVSWLNVAKGEWSRRSYGTSFPSIHWQETLLILNF